jgi:nicotinamide-nucleotide amidase
MQDLLPLAQKLGDRLKQRRETIVIAESSTGGLISAALLSVPGASAYFLGGAVVYTLKAREIFANIPNEAVKGMRSASEPYAALLARTTRERFGAEQQG